MNTRKRGKNLSTKEKEKIKEREEKEKNTDKDKDKDQNPLRRSKTQPTSNKPDTGGRESDDDEDGGGSSDGASNFDRPLRNIPLIGMKREYPGSPVPETPLSPGNKPDYKRPAECYLPLGEGEFRILLLAPGRKDDLIYCSFVTASEARPVEGGYEAISYVWGAMRQDSMKIRLVDPQGESHPFWIRSNLHAALRSLRHPKDTRPFWVDALCINHSSDSSEEKNKQIEMKLYVFRNARNLCFWLGEDTNCKTALKFIPRILDLAGIEKLVRDESVINEWTAFVDLLHNPVFSRLWLVQEVAVARNVTLHCGQPAIHYGDLVEAVALFMAFRTEISLLFRNRKESYKQLTDGKVTMAKRFIDVSTNAMRITYNKAKRVLSLEALVSHLFDLGSSDGLDRIYSVLAIAKDGPELNEETLLFNKVQPDGTLQIRYEKSVLEVYQSFVIRSIKLSQSLNIICRHWASSVDEVLPTWVRPLQLPRQTAFNSNTSERTDPDSFVGFPDHSYYHASRGTVADYQVDPRADYRKSISLFVKGIRLDTIAKLGPRAQEGVIPYYEWLVVGGCVDVLKEDGENYSPEDFLRALIGNSEPNGRNVSPEDFLRTLIANRGPKGIIPPPYWYTRAFLHCLHHLTSSGDINTSRLIAKSEAESFLVVEFLQRVQSVTWNRKFLVSKDYKWIGLAPMAAKNDDVIAVLYGCSVPVVLRLCEEPGAGERYFQLVGECYVHGMMDGDAIPTAIAHGYREEEFELR